MKGLEGSTNSLKGELAELTQKYNALEQQNKQVTQKLVEEYSPAVTIVATNMPYSKGEDTYMKACDLLYNHMDMNSIHIVKAKRTPEREGKPGIVKIELGSTEEKISVLRQKSKLASSQSEYNRVYLRSSKPHVERLTEINFRTLLRELPNGNQYRMTGNGRIIRKDDDGRTRNRMDNYRNPTSARDQPNRRGMRNFSLQSQDEFPDTSLFSQNSLLSDNNHA